MSDAGASCNLLAYRLLLFTHSISYLKGEGRGERGGREWDSQTRDSLQDMKSPTTSPASE